VGGKVVKKAKEGGKVDKFMDVKQTMIGAFDWKSREEESEKEEKGGE